MSYSAVYRRPDGTVQADWIAYDTLAAAMLGPATNRYVGKRLGYIARSHYGPPQLFGVSQREVVDLAR